MASITKDGIPSSLYSNLTIAGAGSQPGITFDAGSGNSPLLRFIGGTNDDIIDIWLSDNVSAGASDLRIDLADAAGASVIDVRDSANTQVAVIGSTGYIWQDQLTVDGDICRFSSTGDVAHGVTDVMPTVTYGAIQKDSSTTGGVRLEGVAEGSVGVALEGSGVTTNTTKSAAGRGFVELRGFQTSGTGKADAGANVNIAVFQTQRSSSVEAVWIVDAEGDVHIDGTQNTYDDLPDAHLCRALDLATSPNVIESEWDRYLTVNRQTLEELKILSPEGFLNTTKLQRLHNGAIWQLAQRLERLERILFHPIQTLKGFLWKQ